MLCMIKNYLESSQNPASVIRTSKYQPLYITMIHGIEQRSINMALIRIYAKGGITHKDRQTAEKEKTTQEY